MSIQLWYIILGGVREYDSAATFHHMEVKGPDDWWGVPTMGPLYFQETRLIILTFPLGMGNRLERWGHREAFSWDRGDVCPLHFYMESTLWENSTVSFKSWLSTNKPEWYHLSIQEERRVALQDYAAETRERKCWILFGLQDRQCQKIQLIQILLCFQMGDHLQWNESCGQCSWRVSKLHFLPE